MECISSTLPSLTWTLFHALFLEKYVRRTLRDCKKDEFFALEQGSMCMAAYEGKFHALSRNAMKLLTTEDESFRLIIIGLDPELQVLSVHMTSRGKSFNKVSGYVKKLEGVRRDGQTKVLDKRSKNAETFQNSYARYLVDLHSRLRQFSPLYLPLSVIVQGLNLIILEQVIVLCMWKAKEQIVVILDLIVNNLNTY